MKIAYVISAYKYPEQLIRLVLKLNTEGTSFFIHIDKKTSHTVYTQVVQSLKHLVNVYFLERHICYWGDIGHINATIKGIKALFSSSISFDYVILLTGQDYPIKSNKYIKEFLKANLGNSFMEFFPVNLSSSDEYPVSSTLWSSRIERWHFVLFGELRPIIPNRYLPFPVKHKFPKGFEPFVGSSYWILSKECIEYINNFITNNSKFLKNFKYVSVSDEVFFQTIILNSHLKDKIVNDNLRYIKWTGSNWTGKPKILDTSDLDDMISSSKLFARKFDNTQDANVLNLIDKFIK